MAMNLPTQLLRSVMDYWWDFSQNDKRVANWFLMEDVIPTTYICLFYIAFCLVAPRVLKGRKFHIDPLVRAYNIAMVAMNAYIAYELYANTIGHYRWICDEVDYSMNPRSMRIAWAIYLFWFSKLVELLDSVFFILRGKYNQLTFLHVYHHSTMPFVIWFGANFAPGGNSVFGPAQNAVVHVIMYGYYFLASFGPRFRKYLWWKKYLTLLQLVQFSVNLGFLINFLLNPGMCEFPHWMPKFMVFYMSSFLVLFGNFYMISYIKSSYTSKPVQNGGAANGAINGKAMLNGTAVNGAAMNGTAKKHV